jgi:hypothetical protein
VIQVVRAEPATNQETVAPVVDLINSGQVRLCGDAAGATIAYSVPPSHVAMVIDGVTYQ